MNTHSKIFLLAAAVLLLATGAFAQHDHGDHGKGKTCPHMSATSIGLDQAIAYLEKAKTDPASVDKALAEVRAAKAQVTQCQEMCQKGMCGGHEGHAGMQDHGNHAGHAAATAQPASKKVTDPVCGMQIDPATAAGKSVYAGKTYYFCSKDEKAQFDKDPEKYLKKG